MPHHVIPGNDGRDWQAEPLYLMDEVAPQPLRCPFRQHRNADLVEAPVADRAPNRLERVGPPMRPSTRACAACLMSGSASSNVQLAAVGSVASGMSNANSHGPAAGRASIAFKSRGVAAVRFATTRIRLTCEVSIRLPLLAGVCVDLVALDTAMS
jgi:hypothetical protein